MDVELIDKSHLKITLQKSDLQSYHLTFETLSYESEQTRDIIKEILAEASHLTGFLYTRCRLLIEVFPGSDNGCIIFFTRIQKQRSVSRLKLRAGSRCMIFCFDNANDLMFCSERLHQDDKLCQSSSLYLMDNNYYLVVNSHIGEGRRTYLILSEFASIDCPQNESFYAERGKLLCKNNALQTIGVTVKGKI